MFSDSLIYLLLAWLAYFTLHSALASLAVKSWVAARRPELMPAYRIVFNVLAILGLVPILWLLYNDPGRLVWGWHGAWAYLANGLALIAVAGVFLTLRDYDGGEFLGLRQWRNRIRSVADQEAFHLSPAHRFVRHPWYFFSLVIIWTRDMSEAMLLSAVAMTAYFIVGSRLEERKLIAYHGARYLDYMERVAALVPLPWKILDQTQARNLVGAGNQGGHVHPVASEPPTVRAEAAKPWHPSPHATDRQPGPMNPALSRALDQINAIVLGKDRQVRLCLACLLARGHLLIEDVPGVGKTTLAHALARTLGLDFHRIQFTSDLLPADILGAAIYDRESGQFSFHPGPIFAQVILADEINRASPKAQSALLEAMEEGQVSIEGETRPLPSPFFVIATQNPGDQIGAFPLPESQLDRFLLRIRLGFPEHAAERALLRGEDRRDLLAGLAPVLTPDEFADQQRAARAVHVSDALLDYLQALIAASRNDSRFAAGLSPRAGLGLLRASQAWAYLEGRDFAQPEDVQAVLPALVPHRLFPAVGTSRPGEDWAARLLLEVAIP